MATKKTTTKAKTKKTATSKKVIAKTAAKKDGKATVANRQAKVSQVSRINSLRRWNIILAVVLVLQAVALFMIGKAFALPITSQYLTPDALASQAVGHQVLAPAVRHVFSVDVRYLILAFLLVPAVIYLIIATIRRKEFEEGLQYKVSRYRWLSFGISSAIMLTLIAMLNGAQEITTLLAVVVLVGILHFLGYFGEAKVPELKAKLQSFVALCVVGATVWLIIASYLKGALIYGNGLNSYTYWIDGTIFVLTLLLAGVKLQILRAKGRWADYLMGEQAFMILSFIAITALTWLTFAGFLT
jgi:hypothetical protein